MIGGDVPLNVNFALSKVQLQLSAAAVLSRIIIIIIIIINEND